jgi:hypothetical protein
MGREKFIFNSNSDVADFLRNLTMQRLRFADSESFWNGKFKPQFAETLTRVGLGFSFNMIDADDLLNFNVTSRDFGYKYNDKNDVKRPLKGSQGT